MSDWLDKLEAFADAATPGPWVFGEMPENEATVLINPKLMDRYDEPLDGGTVFYPRIIVDTVNMTDEDANHVEAFNPATVKAMCAVIRAAEEAVGLIWPSSLVKLAESLDALRELVEG